VRYLLESERSSSRAVPATFLNGKLNLASETAGSGNNSPKTPIVLFASARSGAHTTTAVTVVNPITRRQYKVRALLDQGANSSFISDSAVKSFGLRVDAIQDIGVGVFLHDKPVSVQSGIVDAFITNGRGFELPLTLGTLPQLPQDITTMENFDAITPNLQILNS